MSETGERPGKVVTEPSGDNDGYRALLIKDGKTLQIRSRNNKDLTRMYPSIAAAGLRLNADQTIVYGEIVAVNEQGRQSFQALQHRGSYPGPGHHIVFYAFEVLHLNGRNHGVEHFRTTADEFAAHEDLGDRRHAGSAATIS